jgi:hypothetical protein
MKSDIFGARVNGALLESRLERELQPCGVHLEAEQPPATAVTLQYALIDHSGQLHYALSRRARCQGENYRKAFGCRNLQIAKRPLRSCGTEYAVVCSHQRKSGGSAIRLKCPGKKEIGGV